VLSKGTVSSQEQRGPPVNPHFRLQMQTGTETMANTGIQTFLRDFSKEVEGGNAAVFAGAGLSIPAGFVDWRRLLKTVAEDIGLDIEKEYNLVAVAQYYCNERNRADISRILLEEFTQDAEVTTSHKILARLPISTYWTTNYDTLIERALEQAGKRPDIKYNVEQLALTLPRRDCVVYKMHGDISNPGQTVLIKDDYEKYFLTNQAFITALTGDLISQTFLFVGFSFSDPNIDYVLSRIRASYVKNMRTHYCFIKQLNETDFADSDTLAYKRRQQDLFIGDLKRFNIQPVLLDSYPQIQEVLARLERIYKTKSVFISGAAHEWGSWPTDRARALVRGLSKTLVDKGYRLVSGFGLGVGSSVISGALEQIYSKKRAKMEDQLILRPFPQESVADFSWPDVLKRYRDDLTDYAGAAVFLFGNKLQDGQVVLSDGVAEEFEIAKQKGLALIPVGSTGFMAQELWKKVMADPAAYYPNCTDQFQKALLTLGDNQEEPSVLIEAVVRVLELWARS
jgi:Sir2- and TIR-associating SLOG family/SIR2-like domain